MNQIGYLYTLLWFHATWILVLLACLFYRGHRNQARALFWITLIYAVLMVGLRPLSSAFVDMEVYARKFDLVQRGLETVGKEMEWVFSGYMILSAQVMSSEAWFFVSACLYVGGMAWAFFKHHNEKAGLVLLFAITTLSFWGYGTNGIRNGIALSLVLLGMAYHRTPLPMLVLFVLAVGTHNSVTLPIVAFFITRWVQRPRVFLFVYICAIALSLVLGTQLEAFFATTFSLEDERFSTYFLGALRQQEQRTGFRWDFLLYSLWPMYIGFKYVMRRVNVDLFYRRLFNTYVLCNACWVLVIRANYSNRFAYLSWFLMPWLLAYPYISEGMVENKRKFIFLLLVHYGFTYGVIMAKFTQ